MKNKLISPAKVTVILLAVILCVVLLAVLLWFWTDAEPVRNPYLNIEDLPSTHIDSVRDVQVVLERPLFWPGREAVEVASEAVTQAEVKNIAVLHDIQLLGIVLNDDVRKAILKVEDGITVIQVGQVIQGWAVEEITAKDITLAGEEQRQTLSLVRERPSSIELEASE